MWLILALQLEWQQFVSGSCHCRAEQSKGVLTLHLKQSNCTLCFVQQPPNEKKATDFSLFFMCLFCLLFLFVFNPKHLNYVIWLCNFSVFESAVGMKTRSGHTLIHQCCCALLSVKRIWRNFKPTCISPVHIMEQFVFTLQRKKERKINQLYVVVVGFHVNATGQFI